MYNTMNVNIVIEFGEGNIFNDKTTVQSWFFKVKKKTFIQFGVQSVLHFFTF